MSGDPMFDKDFYDKMMEVHTNMKHLRDWAEKHDANDKQVHEKLDERVKSLEDDRLKVVGGAGVLGVFGGFLAKWFLK
jgi:putative NADH-flavin reductase